MTDSRRTCCAAAAAVLLLFAAGCGGTETIDRAELEQEVETQLEESVGQDAPKVTCPDELTAEAGATTRCSMTFPEGELGVTVKVESAEGGDAKLDITADEQVEPKGD